LVPSAITYTFAYPIFLEFGDDTHYLNGELAVGCRSVKPLLGGYELDLELLQVLKIVQEEPKIAEEPVQFAHRDNVEAAPVCIVEKPLEFRLFGGRYSFLPGNQ